MTKTKRTKIDTKLLASQVKSQSMVARILNPVSRILKIPVEELTDTHLHGFYVKYLSNLDYKRRFSRIRGIGKDVFVGIENYLLRKGAIHFPSYFAYLPILQNAPKINEHKSRGIAELTALGVRSLVYPIGIKLYPVPVYGTALVLHFGRRINNVSEKVHDLDSMLLTDIKQFKNLHTLVSDSYDRDD